MANFLEVDMDYMQQAKRRIRIIAISGIAIITICAAFGVGSPARQVHRSQPAVELNTSQPQSAQQTATNVLTCADYDTIYGANYNQLLDSSYTFMSQITTRLPGPNQNTALLNFQYNAAAQQAYSLYTSVMQANSCKPSIPAPAPLSPASPPNSSIDPSTLDSSIPTACAYPLALQYVASYYQQYVTNMQNEQTNFTNFLNNLQPPPGVLSQSLMSGAASVQTAFHINVQNLNSTFSSDLSNIGC